MAEAKDDNHVIVEFYTKARENKRKSAAEGRPVFDNVEMVKIRFSGDKLREHHAPAHEVWSTVRQGMGDKGQQVTYAQRFPREYEAYKRQEEIAPSGTPIEELPNLTAAQRAELKSVNILTVEALAGLPSGKPLGMQGDTMIDLAKTYLARAKDGAKDTELVNRLRNQDTEIADLKAQVAALLRKQEKGGKAADDGAGDGNGDEVSEPGPFFGYDSRMLRDYIKAQTGEPPKGNPKLSTLLEMAKEVAAAQADA